MDSSSPNLPRFIEFSQVSYETVAASEDQKQKGLGALNPYLTIGEAEGLKQFQVKVEGYNGDEIMDADTAKLFLGCTTETTGDSAYPYKGEEIGEMGGPTKSMPLSLQRIHFFGTVGVSGTVKEYYTHVLCGRPVEVKSFPILGRSIGGGTDEPVDGLTSNQENPSTSSVISDQTEETAGTAKYWNSTHDLGGNYPERLIIGGCAFKTGWAIVDVRVTHNSDSCFAYLETRSGIALFPENSIKTEDWTRHNLGFNSGYLISVIEDLCDRDSDIGDAISDIVACLCNTGSATGQTAEEARAECCSGLSSTLSGLYDDLSTCVLEDCT